MVSLVPRDPPGGSGPAGVRFPGVLRGFYGDRPQSSLSAFRLVISVFDNVRVHVSMPNNARAYVLMDMFF